MRNLIILFAFVVSQLSCAFAYVDKSGGTNVIGLVKMRIPSTHKDVSPKGLSIDISNIGFFIHSTPISSGISIGYTHDKISSLDNNMGICSESLLSKYSIEDTGGRR